MNNHISDRDLLGAADGELSRRRAAQVSSHLADCWACRTRMRDLEGAIDEFIHAHIDESAPHIPTIEGPRALLRARIAELEEARSSGRWEQLWSPMRWRISPSYAAITLAVVAVALFLLTSQRNIPTVLASEVLSKAEAGENSKLRQAKRPVVYQRVRIKVGARSFSRTIYRDTMRARHVEQVEQLEDVAAPGAKRDLNSVEQLFSEAKLDWNAPLSPSGFNRWRAAHRKTAEQVRRDSGTTEIRTSTPDGPISEARLTLRNGDLHPLAESLRLRDNSLVEIAELDYGVLELNQLRADLFEAAAPVAGVADVSKLAGAGLVRTNPLNLELEVIKRLDHANVFLGDQITVERDQKAVVVRGVVDDAGRRSELLQALGPVLRDPALKLRIVVPGDETGQGVSANDTPVSAEGVESLHNAPAETSLRAYFEKRAASGAADEEMQRFTDEVSRRSQSARAHALALKQIAERFSQSDLNAMTSEQHHEWRRMLNGHAREILSETRAMRESLEPIFRTNLEEKHSLTTNLTNDADLIDAATRLSKLTAANDNAVWHSFAASTQASTLTLVCLPEFWESLLDAEILAQEILANTTNGE